FFSSRRRHTRSKRDWSSDVCSSDLRVYSSFEGILNDSNNLNKISHFFLTVLAWLISLSNCPKAFATCRLRRFISSCSFNSLSVCLLLVNPCNFCTCKSSFCNHLFLYRIPYSKQ